jgi:hypothetical protein
MPYFETNGKGLWSDVAKKVFVKYMKITYISERHDDDETDFEECGLINFYFDKDTWNVRSDGLIYTDKKFMFQLKNHLSEIGLYVDENNLHYSEQGMQGVSHVSCDISAKFLSSWRSIYGKRKMIKLI